MASSTTMTENGPAQDYGVVYTTGQTATVPGSVLPSTREAMEDVGEQPQMRVVPAPKYVVPLSKLDERPEFIDCPYCQKRTKTKVVHDHSSSTHIAGAFCCVFCGVIGVIFPYACNWFQDTDHVCTECHRVVTHRPHDGEVQVKTPSEANRVPSQFGPVQMVDMMRVDAT